MSVSTGDQVTWGGWAYLESGNGLVHWNMIAYDINKNPVSYLAPSPSNVSATAWTYQVGTYTVPSGIAYVVVYAEIWNATAPTVARFDDGFISVGTHYYHPDHLSTRLITDASGNVAGQQGHFPFGEAWYAQNTTSKWRFTSYEHDAESGNEYALARSYINRLARFSSPDPAGLAAVDPSNPQSWNRYAYVGNDPLDFIDPQGLFKNCGDFNNWCGTQNPIFDRGECYNLFLDGISIGNSCDIFEPPPELRYIFLADSQPWVVHPDLQRPVKYRTLFWAH